MFCSISAEQSTTSKHQDNAKYCSNIYIKLSWIFRCNVFRFGMVSSLFGNRYVFCLYLYYYHYKESQQNNIQKHHVGRQNVLGKLIIIYIYIETSAQVRLCVKHGASLAEARRLTFPICLGYDSATGSRFKYTKKRTLLITVEFKNFNARINKITNYKRN